MITPSATCPSSSSACLSVFSFSQGQAHAPVARQGARAREDQVAHASQSHHREGLGPHQRGDPGDLCEASGDDGGACVESQTQPIADAAADGHDVLQGAANADAHHVVGVVDARHVAVERFCGALGRFVGFGGDHQGGGETLGELEGEGRPRDHRDVGSLGELFAQHGGHGLQGSGFDPLRAATDEGAGAQGLGCAACDLPQGVGRHHRHHEVGHRRSLAKIGMGPQVLRQLHLAQVARIATGAVDLLAPVGVSVPEDDFVAASGELNRECGAEAASSPNGDGVCQGTSSGWIRHPSGSGWHVGLGAFALGTYGRVLLGG